MPFNNYILKDGEPVVCEDIVEWARWYEKSGDQRIVGRTNTPKGDVSTVFLGLDHSHGGGPPVLWETMVFGGLLSDECERYTSLEDAKSGHARWVHQVNQLVAATERSQ